MIFLIPLLVVGLTLFLFLVALHLGFRAPRTRETKTPVDFGVNDYREVLVPSVAGKKLFSWLLPVENSTEIIIILHGWGGNAELMMPVAMPFYKAGLNVLLIDSRGHGNSDSDTFSSLPRFAEDLGKAIGWIKSEHPSRTEKIALLGHSVGAGAVLLEASRRNDIDAVISVSAFAHPEWMMQRYLKHFHLPGFLIIIVLRYVEWVIGHSYSSFAPLSTVCRIESPVLIVHGKEDTTVPIDDAYTIIEMCPEPHLEIFEVDDAGHESVDKIEEHATFLIDFLGRSGFHTSLKKHQ